jgi:hypothetical protein
MATKFLYYFYMNYNSDDPKQFWSFCYTSYQSARSVTAGKFDKCWHFLSIFIAW